MVRTLENTLAALAAAFIPAAVYVVSHKAAIVGLATMAGILLALLTLGGLVYSAPSLYGWAKSWTGSPAKAAGFTVLLEGVMTISQVGWLAMTALALLVLVNALVAWTKANERQGSAFKVRRRKSAKKNTANQGKAHPSRPPGH